MFHPAVQLVLDGYKSLLNLDISKCNHAGTEYPLPHFDEACLTALCDQAILRLKHQPIILRIQPPLYVVGDIHGNIFDLIRLLLYARPPPYSKFLFLGDYVDRGKFSIEVATLLLALQAAFPEHIYLLRGNHEFESVNYNYGFFAECEQAYPTGHIYEKFNSVFEWLPLAAMIDNETFCVHGGLSPSLSNLSQFQNLNRPLKTYTADFVADLVWSDPSTDAEKCATYCRSTRGTGYYFGTEAVDNFLETFHLKRIIRAHQCIQQGIATFNNQKLFTVFSCSNYIDAINNRCGLLFINKKFTIECFSIPPIEQIDREKVIFMNYQYTDIDRSYRLRYKNSPIIIPKFEPKFKSARIGSLRSVRFVPTGTYFPFTRSLSQSDLPPLLCATSQPFEVE